MHHFSRASTLPAQDPGDVGEDVPVRLTRLVLQNKHVWSTLEDKSAQGKTADQSRFDPDTQDTAVNKRELLLFLAECDHFNPDC